MLSNEILDVALNSENIVPHFHIPLQSGSDKILKLMRRRYKTRDYKKLILNIKKQNPSVCIGADVIVGFPEKKSLILMKLLILLNHYLFHIYMFFHIPKETTQLQKN